MRGRAIWPLLVVACAPLDDAPDDDPVEPPTVCPVRAPVVPLVVATLPTPLVEVSGMVASPSGQELLWMHNDSGDAARVFAVRRDGALVATLSLPDVVLVDAEDIAAGPCPDGVGRCLVVADTGDNLKARDDAHLAFVREPSLDEETLAQELAADVVVDAPLRYEGGPVDVEAIAFAPDGARVILVEKIDDARARVFVVDAPFTDDGRLEARVLGEVASPGLPVPLGRAITALDVHPSGRAVVVRAYTGVFEFVTAAPATSDRSWARLFASVPVRVATGPLREPQGESVAYDLDGRTVLLASEILAGGGGQPLFAVPCAE